MAAFSTSRLSWHYRVALYAALLATFLAACSSSASSPSASSGSGTKYTPANVTWGAGVITMLDSIGFVAMGLGSFRKYNLNVQFVNGPSAPTLLATGKADIIQTRFSDVPLLISQGEPVKTFGTVAVGIPVGLLGSNQVKSLKALQAMGGNCTIGGTESGTFFAYENYLIKKFHLKCKVDTLSNFNLAIDGVASGRYTVAPEYASNAGAVLAAKQAHWLIDPSNPHYAADGYALPYEPISSALVASSAYLKANSGVVKRFVAALQDTEQRMKKMSNEQIAEAIKKSNVTYWQPQSIPAIVEQLTGSGIAKNVFALDKLDLAPMSKKLYNGNLDTSLQQGVNINPKDPRFAYSKAVDNSFIQ